MKKELSTLSKKIIGYSSLAASLVTVANLANGQVVYTDVNPDATGTGNGANYDLDLNNDGTADFQFSVSSDGVGVKMVVKPTGNNALAGTIGPYNFTYPSVFNLNELIGETASWKDGATQTLASTGYYTGSYGNWFGEVDKYLPLRFEISGEDHYAWARMDVSDDGKTFTVKDYAYESTEGTAIAAGNTGNVGITPVNASGFKIFAANQQVHVQLKNSLSGDVTITNLLGQRIKQVEINSSVMAINMSDEASAIYMVTVRQNGEVFTQKIVL